MKTLGSVLIALLVPLAWGLLSAWGYDRVSDRRQMRCAEEASEEEQAA